LSVDEQIRTYKLNNKLGGVTSLATIVIIVVRIIITSTTITTIMII